MIQKNNSKNNSKVTTKPYPELDFKNFIPDAEISHKPKKKSNVVQFPAKPDLMEAC